jgi:hypothetical protein
VGAGAEGAAVVVAAGVAPGTLPGFPAAAVTGCGLREHPAANMSIGMIQKYLRMNLFPPWAMAKQNGCQCASPFDGGYVCDTV